MGLYGMAMGMAVLVGYGLSGTMASRLGYDFIFYVGSAALLLAVFVALAMPRNGEPAKSGPHTPLRQDLRATAGMLRRRGLTTSYCCIFAQYFAFGGVVTLLPIYVEDLGMEAFHVGMLLATFAVVYGLLQFHSGAFSDRRGRRLPVTVGLCLSILSLTIMPSLQTFALLAVVMAVYGTAYALLFPSISALIADRAAPDELGRATGMFHALLTAGVALGAPVMGWTGQCIGIEPGLALTAVAPGMALIITQLDLRKRT